METQQVTVNWRGLAIVADVYSEPDPLRSDGSKLYDIGTVAFTGVPDEAAQLIFDAYEPEIRETILEAVR